MSSLLTNLKAKFSTLPRAGKWGVIFVVFLAAYFGVLEPYVTYLGGINTEADRIEAKLRERASLKGKLTNNAAVIDAGINAFGIPELPKIDDRSSALTRKLDSVLAGKNVTEKRRLTRDNLPALTLGASTTIKRVGIELQIECETPELLAIIRELELAPEVSAVSRVDVRRISEVNYKTGGGLLAVSLVVEMWSISTAADKPASSESGSNS